MTDETTMTLEQAVQKRYSEMTTATDRPRLEFLARGWKEDPDTERAIALRESGPEGRAIVEQAYQGSWDLAFYEDGKRAVAELARRRKEQQR